MFSNFNQDEIIKKLERKSSALLRFQIEMTFIIFIISSIIFQKKSRLSKIIFQKVQLMLGNNYKFELKANKISHRYRLVFFKQQ